MNAKELIKQLLNVPPNAQVRLVTSEMIHNDDPTNVWLEEVVTEEVTVYHDDECNTEIILVGIE